MVIGTLLTCQPVTKNQIIGTVVIVFAAILMVLDPYAMRTGESPNILADMVAIASSVPYATYFYFMQRLNEHLPIDKIVLC